MKKLSVLILLAAFVSLFLIGVPAGEVLADGTETLGTPSIAIEDGSNFVTAGTGMENQPGTIDIDVPGEVVQVLLYWMGRGTPDNTISVDGTSILGTQIGFSNSRIDSVSYRADITQLGLVDEGFNSLSINEMDFSDRADGVAVLVIFDDGSVGAEFEIRDGNDFVYIYGPTPKSKVSVPQTFNFGAAAFDRTAVLTMFTGDGTSDRPDIIKITVGSNAPIVLCNEIIGNVGAAFDVIEYNVDIPAGATDVTVEIFSEFCGGLDATPESIGWMLSALSVPPTPTAALGDFVWLDVHGDGIQDPDEPGVPGVTVILLDGDCDVLLDTTTTDDGGIYGFTGLTPGDYCVEFVLPDGASFTVPNAGPDDEDSDADPATGQTGKITLPAGEEDLTWDAGLICTPPGGGLCTDRITATTLQYTGPDISGPTTVVFDPDKKGVSSVTYVLPGGLANGQILINNITENGFTVDARFEKDELGSKMKIFINGVEEKIHTSCSAIYAAGAPAPLDKPKGDPSPNWFVINFLQKDGIIVDDPGPVGPVNPAFDQLCADSQPVACDDTTKVAAITFIYTGEACQDPLPNPQGEGGKSKAKCDDFAPAGANPVQVVYTGKKAGEYDVDPPTMTINVGGEVAISRGGKKFDADTKLEISDEFGLVQKLEIHTSCSKDLAEGDEFGSLFVEDLELIPK